MGKRSSTGLLAILAAGRQWRTGSSGVKHTLTNLLEMMGNFDGEWYCWPSMDTLAYETEQSVGSVRRHIMKLAEQGLITREIHSNAAGGRTASKLILNVATLLGDEEPNAQKRSLGSAPPNAQTSGAQNAIDDSECAFGAITSIRTVDERSSNGETSRESTAEARFVEHFWPAYPARDGKKVEKEKALAQWTKLSIEDQRAAVKGAKNYATSGRIPKDAHRWLRDRLFEEWQTPATPSTNGNGNGTHPVTGPHRAGEERGRHPTDELALEDW